VAVNFAQASSTIEEALQLAAALADFVNVPARSKVVYEHVEPGVRVVALEHSS